MTERGASVAMASSNACRWTCFLHSLSFAFASASLGAILATRWKSFKASLYLPSAQYAEPRR